MQKYMINIFRQFNLLQALRKVSSFPPFVNTFKKIFMILIILFKPHYFCIMQTQEFLVEIIWEKKKL